MKLRVRNTAPPHTYSLWSKNTCSLIIVDSAVRIWKPSCMHLNQNAANQMGPMKFTNNCIQLSVKVKRAAVFYHQYVGGKKSDLSDIMVIWLRLPVRSNRPPLLLTRWSCWGCFFLFCVNFRDSFAWKSHSDPTVKVTEITFCPFWWSSNWSPGSGSARFYCAAATWLAHRIIAWKKSCTDVPIKLGRWLYVNIIVKLIIHVYI